MSAGYLRIAYMLLLVPNILLAEEPITNADKPNIQVRIDDKAKVISLEARRAPLGQIMDEIASKTGTHVHYSILPNELVTAACAGKSVKAVIKCLLGPSANIMFRYPSELSKEDSPKRPAELWILGSSFDDGQPSVQVRDSSQWGTTGAERKRESGQTETTPTISPQSPPEDTYKLVETVQSGDPAQRANALARLIADGRTNKSLLRATLENTLLDEDASVRAQAVYGLARQGGATAMLQAALRDSDASVRLMAVDSADTSIQGLALLQEALTDSDEAVSALAALKLESLVNSGLSR